MVDTVRDIRTRFIGDNRMGSAARGARRDIRGISDEYDVLRRRISVTNQAIAGVTLGIGGGSAARTLSNLQNQTARLSTLTNTFAKDQAFLSATSRRLSIDIEAATAAFSRFNVLEQAGALSSGESEVFLEGLGNAFSRFGAQASQQENVIYGLAQALGQGNLQAQELNQVVEPLPGLLNDIAKQAGFTAAGYRQLVKDGKVTSQVFKRDILGALRTYDGSAAALSGNIQQTLTRLSNAYKETLIVLQQPITDGVAQLSDAVIGGLSIVTENSGATVAALQLVGATIAITYASRGLRAIQNFTSGYADLAKRQIRLSRETSEAYQRNTSETVAAEARKEKALRASARESAKVDLSKADTSREAAARAAAKSREAVAQRRLTQAKIEAELSDRKQILSQRQLALETAKTTDARARAALIIAKADARVLASTDKRKASEKALRVATREAVAAEKAVETATNRVNVARERVSTSTAKYATRSERLAIALQKQAADSTKLAASEKARLAATLSSVTANQAYNASLRNVSVTGAAAAGVITRTTVAMQAQALAARAGLGAVKGLESAYNLLGGPTGAVFAAGAALFAVYRNITLQSEAVQDAKQKIGELEQGYLGLRDGAQSANEKLTVFYRLTQDIQRGKPITTEQFLDPGIVDELTFIEKLLGSISPTAGRVLANARRGNQSDQAEQQLALLRITELRTLQNIEAGNAAEQEAKNNLESYKLMQQQVQEAEKFAKAFSKSSNEADVVRDKIKAIDAVLNNRNQKLTDDQRKRLELGLRDSQAELDKVTGVTKELEKQAKAREDSISAIKRIEESLDSELNALKREFDDNDLRLRASVELKAADGSSLFDQDELDTLIVLNAQRREEKITEFTRKEQEKRKNDAETALREAESKEEESYRRRLAVRNALANAQETLGDPFGAIEERLAIKKTELEREFGLGNEYRTLTRAAELDSARQIEAAKTAIVAEELKKRQQQFRVVETDRLAGIGTKFLQALTKEVGSYIQITENMSDAEKKSAERSNQINKAQFEKNKKFRKSSAIIDTFAGANRALAQGGIFGVGEAAAIVALGLRNVANINKQSYNSSSSSSSGGSTSGGSSTTGSESNSSISNTTAAPTQGNVFFVGAPGESTSSMVQRYNDFLPALKKAAKQKNITIDGNSVSVSDISLLSTT